MPEGFARHRIPQLSKHEKKFSLSSLGKGSKMRSYEDAFLWLDDAMVVNVCYNTTRFLDKFTAKFKAQSDSPIVLRTKDLKVENGISYLPLYMTPML